MPRLSITLPLRVTKETQTQQKLKGIKAFSRSSCTGLLHLLLCRNTLKPKRQKLKKKLSIYLKTETVCVCCFCSLLLHFCNVNKRQMSSFHSLSNGFAPDLMAVAPATALAALHRAGVSINSGEPLSRFLFFITHQPWRSAAHISSHQPFSAREVLPQLLSHRLMLLIS